LGVESEACAWIVWISHLHLYGPVAEPHLLEDALDVELGLVEWHAGLSIEVGDELVVELSDCVAFGDGLVVGPAQAEVFAEGGVVAGEHGEAAGVGDTAEEGRYRTRGGYLLVCEGLFFPDGGAHRRVELST
jgi:hypothetical protein